MRFLVLCLLGLLSQAAYAEQLSPLAGSWKIVSLTFLVEGEPPQDVYGKQPKGHMILTPTGRLISVVTADGRKFGASDADRVALFRTMYAYSGTYRIEGSALIVDVDASWNETWNGSHQVRNFKLEGNRLSIENPAAPDVSTYFPGKTVTYVAIWEREQEQ